MGNKLVVKPITKPPYLFSGFLLFSIIMHFIRGLPMRGHYGILLMTGLVLIGIGSILIIWAVSTLKKNDVDPRFKRVDVIVDKGPFAYSRNPMYLAFTIIYIGAAFLFHTYWPLVLLPVLIGVVHFGVIRREEVYLEELFGDKYRDYTSRTRRWL